MTDMQTRPGTEDRAEGTAGATAPTRRVVLAGAGALGATCVLAACGTNNTSGNYNGGEFTNDPAPAGSAGTDGQQQDPGSDSGASNGTLAAVGDVPSGGGVIKGDYVITQPAKGQFRAFSKVCTHQGCDVSRVDNGVIICPCHNSTFSIEDGSPTGGPATRALPETKVKVDGDNIVAA
ncbi:Rieske (2Fe-2S) protein [Mangrovihabitans endophyticus]|uniref:Cytochrome bc1 complex Rieske iron-sulfur subunit n=1 Tax=Mangrovihabitans endophyticus TaxID=1751298 RepID=A0A8J3FM93_9ACTN|nr:Rieske (2Fe-2S) protein [Mangrovihabitans endophyticus]GGK71430.1 iron-sulfur protein [Mangrovihabitans endophyticus]